MSNYDNVKKILNRIEERNKKKIEAKIAMYRFKLDMDRMGVLNDCALAGEVTKKWWEFWK